MGRSVGGGGVMRLGRRFPFVGRVSSSFLLKGCLFVCFFLRVESRSNWNEAESVPSVRGLLLMAQAPLFGSETGDAFGAWFLRMGGKAARGTIYQLYLFI